MPPINVTRCQPRQSDYAKASAACSNKRHIADHVQIESIISGFRIRKKRNPRKSKGTSFVIPMRAKINLLIFVKFLLFPSCSPQEAAIKQSQSELSNLRTENEDIRHKYDVIFSEHRTKHVCCACDGQCLNISAYNYP